MIFIKEKSMKNLFELSEEEKNSIRGLHESYKSKPGTKIIWEQTEDVTLNKLNEKIKNVLLSNKNKVYQNVTVTHKNLLTSASITLGNTVNINLDYNQKFDNVFSFKNDLPNTEQDDFTARTAKFYDTNFYVAKIDGTNEILEFKIHSGSVTISIDYDKLYFVNSDSEFPFYSPQNYKISGNVKAYTSYDQLSSFISDPRRFNELIPAIFASSKTALNASSLISL